ncbi:MAG: hypothetical protein KIS91_18755 [Anaerolineae bacterium]|nr:hypothetical protein [Anaerolineae bacterium]
MSALIASTTHRLHHYPSVALAVLIALGIAAIVGLAVSQASQPVASRLVDPAVSVAPAVAVKTRYFDAKQRQVEDQTVMPASLATIPSQTIKVRYFDAKERQVTQRAGAPLTQAARAPSLPRQRYLDAKATQVQRIVDSGTVVYGLPTSHARYFNVKARQVEALLR